jgi:hypothetical protein
MTDPAKTYAELKIETAQMLGFVDIDKLSPVDGLKLDLVSLLRLQVDHMQGLALTGESINMEMLSSCVQLLQRLLPASVTQAPIVETDDDDIAEKFARHIDGIIRARRHSMARSPDEAQNAFEEDLKEAIAEFGDAEGLADKRAPMEKLKQIIAEKDAVIVALGGKLKSIADETLPGHR